MLVPRGSRSVALTVCAALLLATVGCGSDDEAGESDRPILVRLYGTDANMGNPLGEAFDDQPGVLAGMKGTTPLDSAARRLQNAGSARSIRSSPTWSTPQRRTTLW